MFIVIADLDGGGRSVTNDADNVVRRVSHILGGIGRRRLYYRDSYGRYDELRVVNEQFSRFAACSEKQQHAIAGWVSHSQRSVCHLS
ncbi:hypothetical protein GCM10007159_41280 [Modicisalibacter luteus]|nr:hypothetical protein GCM10007159_41280 [Halomonas lutea]